MEDYEQPPEEKLLLIDGLNIVRRVYEAIPADDSPEKAQGALRSSLASFRRALSEHRPSHVLAPFDFGGRTWRHDLYPAYRQKRKPMPQDLRAALPEFRERIKDIGIHSISVEGVEADDVIGTVGGLWAKRKPGAELVVVSNDKDMTVMLAQGARIRDHFKPEWRDAAWVKAKFFVPPELVHDVLALTGDDSDDVPGVPDVGATTAGQWIAKYGGLENLLAAAGELKGKRAENLRAHVDQVRLSRKLVAFKTDISLGLTWNQLRYQVPVAA
ncbi:MULTISPECIES: 5'-3' exonuclease H3TH domain-containing protein [unclassified Variovorax]|uniref:5'-3' exonuclease n=1 Tax=unclassified Variovorax TaxID=663243 RepID=UPI00076C06F5|nr:MULTISPECIES: 5'-3' exonuclease H3TH domain-containing protein [unclassified Variovorax]KWT95532.1 DNA polymerase I [Variovorax sp. WDL1]PNG50136.1 DNA polymerase I [Variovorax sp. B2]PNG51009.1 DNA polymerase I [Variovorax sp. B4]VTV17174.1 DNA polymerase I [Variovorax sp. WDL1]